MQSKNQTLVYLEVGLISHRVVFYGRRQTASIAHINDIMMSQHAEVYLIVTSDRKLNINLLFCF